MPEPIVALDLGYRYDRDWVFRRLDFRLPAGCLTAILGPNGCGKSTLLATLSGLRSPVEGRVSRREAGLALVPQSLEPTLPFTGFDMVLLGRARSVSLFSAPSTADYAAAREALARLEASHLSDRAFDVMSGGERQLVLIARALVSSSAVLLLDEPTAALDWHHQAHVLNLLRQLADDGLAVAFTTHAPQHALDFADQVLLMAEPDHHISGLPEDVLGEEALSKLYRIPVRRFRLPDSECSTAIPVLRGYRPARSAASEESLLS
ncbi:MAG: ABC transporter ATP-binding protein [Candidatus Accumulibacter sp.]|jgi:iron complex transport system ATP-binding protein|nr:ABC transporter ATP-binding protein [Accumulibacter sp.]